MSESLEINLDLDKLFQPAWATSPSDPNKYARYDGTEGESRGDRRFGRGDRPRPGGPGGFGGPRPGGVALDRRVGPAAMAVPASLGIPRVAPVVTDRVADRVVRISVLNR